MRYLSLTTGVTTGETPETVVKKMDVRLCAYRCACEAVHRIYRPWGWHAPCNNICAQYEPRVETFQTSSPGLGRPTVNFVNWVMTPVTLSDNITVCSGQ